MKKFPILILVVIFIVSISIRNYFEYKIYYFDGGTRYSEFKDVMEKRIQFETKISTENGEQLIVIAKRSPLWLTWGTISCPAVYIFDQNNQLIDFSYDSGDDPRFLRENPILLDILRGDSYKASFNNDK